MGIDQRFTAHFAERFIDLNVLETCTGVGFTTISLARTAKHVFTVEIDKSIQKQAIYNVQKAGLSTHVSFIHGSILDQNLLGNFLPVDAAFIDPDWAATGPDHIYRFIHSNTQPPADTTLRARAKITSHFCISASAHLWPMPHSQNPRNSSLFLWFCSLGSAKPEPNPSANSAKLFLREPLG